MIIYPAIDLKDGNCVRLLRGEMAQATTFNSSPAAQAEKFAQAGFTWLHIVDLNGAFAGEPVNAAAVEAIIRAAAGIKLQLGGGIRNIADIECWLTAGISRVILGTAALKNPQLVKDACKAFPGRIAVGIDARDGKVAVEGWAETSQMEALELAQRFEGVGVSAIIYTDIERDGAMQGPNIESTARLAEQLSIPVILSGGVSSVADISAISARSDCGIAGIIIGRAFYDGSIDFAQAQAAITENNI